MVDPVVAESLASKHYMPRHIRADDAVGLDSLFYYRHQGFCARVGYYGRINLPVALE